MAEQKLETPVVPVPENPVTATREVTPLTVSPELEAHDVQVTHTTVDQTIAESHEKLGITYTGPDAHVGDGSKIDHEQFEEKRKTDPATNSHWNKIQKEQIEEVRQAEPYNTSPWQKLLTQVGYIEEWVKNKL